MGKTFIRQLWKVLISLKFAVVIMTGLTVALIVATTLESMYDTPTAQFYVYKSPWFYAVLGGLFINILCVALSRLPWQKKHIPFLLAHLGILILLYGSWLTFQFGLDGQMTLQEGTQETGVELPESLLAIAENDSVRTVPVPWIPPQEKFKPIQVKDLGLEVVEYLTHAEAKVNFVPTTDPAGPAAIRVKIAGGPTAPPFMKMGQEAWLWLGDRSWTESQFGGARVSIAQDAEAPLPEFGAALGFSWSPSKKIMTAVVRTSDLKKNTVSVRADELKGKVIATGWKFDVTVTVLDFLPNARSEVSYTPSQIQYGMQAPQAAILLQAEENGKKSARTWLGLGERATLQTGGKTVTLGFFPRRKTLPFAIELHRFQIEHYEGTTSPKEFSSIVSVRLQGKQEGDVEPPPENHVISMNEPLKYGGYTFYQTSYIPGEPRPTISVLSVNQDPGRWLKYLGSLLIVAGSALLFIWRYRAMSLRKQKGN